MTKIFLQKIVAGDMQANCYIIAEKDGGKGIIIDPGGDAIKILDIVQENELEILYIVATHAHIDHIADIELIKNSVNAQFLLHFLDLSFLKDPNLNLSFFMQPPRIFSPPEKLAQEGEKIRAGKIDLEILHTPGHTPGSISLKIDKCIFTGDTLFSMSVGRTDLPGGDFTTLQNSIREKILILPDDTRIFPGHGPESTVGKEKEANPFI